MPNFNLTIAQHLYRFSLTISRATLNCFPLRLGFKKTIKFIAFYVFSTYTAFIFSSFCSFLLIILSFFFIFSIVVLLSYLLYLLYPSFFLFFHFAFFPVLLFPCLSFFPYSSFQRDKLPANLLRGFTHFSASDSVEFSNVHNSDRGSNATRSKLMYIRIHENNARSRLFCRIAKDYCPSRKEQKGVNKFKHFKM